MKSIKYLALLIIIIPLLFSCSNNTTEVNTVATPVISPAGGTYFTAQPVTISCGTSNADIYYTTNGTTPDTTATLYNGAITVNHNVVIKAIAVKDNLDDSAVATATFVIYNNMINLPSGTFSMGRTSGTGYADELPVHQVSLTSFYMGKYEVTQAEWVEVMGSNPSDNIGNTNPVEMVSWYAVLVYCNKRSMMEGLTPAYNISGSTDPTAWGSIPTVDNATWNAVTCNWGANGYRLPTEAEWEYTARSAVNNPDYLYSGSNTVGAVAWFADNANESQPVGTKTANGLGFYDMSGNVQEWVWDWYADDYYSTSPVNNPHGPSTGAVHSIRGGSWYHDADFCRVAFRNWGTPEKDQPKVKNDRLGFRVVRIAG